METDSIAILSRLLEEEIRLLESMAQAVNGMQMRLIEKDWSGVERQIEVIGRHSQAVHRSEEERVQICLDICSALGFDARCGLNDIISRLDEKWRRPLAALRRRILVATRGIEGTIRGIEVYVSVVSETMRGMMNELFPQRRIYARDGRAAQSDERAMLIDHRL